MIPTTERRELRAALQAMVGELFKRDGDLGAVDLQRFHAQFEATELPKVIALMARLVSERSFGHFTVEAIDRGAVTGDLFKCRVFMRFVEVSSPGSTGRPSCRVFAFGPRRGVVTNR